MRGGNDYSSAGATSEARNSQSSTVVGKICVSSLSSTKNPGFTLDSLGFTLETNGEKESDLMPASPAWQGRAMETDVLQWTVLHTGLRKSCRPGAAGDPSTAGESSFSRGSQCILQSLSVLNEAVIGCFNFTEGLCRGTLGVREWTVTFASMCSISVCRRACNSADAC